MAGANTHPANTETQHIELRRERRRERQTHSPSHLHRYVRLSGLESSAGEPFRFRGGDSAPAVSPDLLAGR